jgi:predicted RNA-binding protein associated with RNAse of E/G family
VTVLVQEVWDERVWAARPMRLVAETEAGAVLWFPRGTRWQVPRTPDRQPREATRGERLATSLAVGEWTLVEEAWDTSTLQIWPRDAWHSIWVSWRADGSRWGFYGNVQLPYVRTSCGFRTMDLVLDVVAELDGIWRLKDEDELATFAVHGIFDRELERRIRAEADAIAAKLEREEPPFDGSFDEWRPDPDWPAPVLPDGWERVCR